MTGDDLARRLVDLQTRVAYQEDAIEKLDAAVADQEARLTALREALERALSRLERVPGPEPGPSAGHEVPPHY